MEYFDTFTGYGGFTLGIQRAFGLHNTGHSAAHRQKTTETVPRVVSDDKCDTLQRTLSCIGFSEVNKYAIQVYEKHFPEQLCELHTQQQSSSKKPEQEERSQRRERPADQLGKGIRTSDGTTPLCNCRHKNYGDITKINPTELPDFDLLTGGFPCQAFSIAGKRQGFNDTRGTLFFDIARILKVKRPRNFILENVKGLLSHDDGRTFKTIITTLTELGYCVEWQVLNAKDFGVPQNRERVFIVGHLGGVPERKVFPIGESDGLSDKSDGQGKTSGGVASTVSSNLKRGVHSGGETYAIERKIAHTVRTSGRSSGIDKKQNWDSYEVGGRIRRLTPKECERLMGLPDDWTEGQSDTQRYKLCGNGVVVNVVEAVVRKLYNL